VCPPDSNLGEEVLTKTGSNVNFVYIGGERMDAKKKQWQELLRLDEVIGVVQATRR
jgi:hypothetical protein